MIPITARAGFTPDSRFATVSSFGSSRIRHVAPIPAGACPISNNPVSGTATIVYRPNLRALEAVSVMHAITWAASGVAGAPRSVEELANWIAHQAAAATGVAIAVRLDLIINPGPQRIVVDHAVLPGHP
jgi:hypothetical protein